MSPKNQNVSSSSPLPVRERIKVRVRLQRASRAIQNSALLLLFVLAFALAGCGAPLQAQNGGGLREPTIQSQLGHNSIVPSAPALTLQTTNFCNAQAQVDYGYAVLFCENKLATLPVSFTTTYGTQVNADWCYTNQYTNASGQISVPKDAAGNPIIPTLGNCPSGVAPAPVTAPSGASPVRS